jgi:hypothetical protein
VGKDALTDRAVWQLVREYAAQIGIGELAPHDLRRTAAKLCRSKGGELEQIQFLLGHESILTTERYLGSEQDHSQRAGAENLIKEANNDAGLAAHPPRRWATNCVHFQLVMLAYNLNCWLLLFQGEEGVAVDNLEHTRLATARSRFLFVAAKIWKHSGRVGISYSDQYAERGLLQRLMKRLREIAAGPAGFSPVLATSLSG